ncbi:enoyl-CoA delta-isomerase 2 [Aureococcus anophagefferens]|nr:enoyl-CoA delta-isomerase 2 [Aureococcus anophagefferens]
MYLADHELDAQQALASGCVHRISSGAAAARRFARRDASASGRSVEATDARLIQETLLNGEASGAVSEALRALETVAPICAAVAGAHVDAQGPLMEAGVDSLGAAEIVGRLTAEFERELPATLLFDHPTAAAIAAFLQPGCVLEPLDLGPPLLPLDPASPDEGLSLRRRGDGVVVVTYDRPDRSNAVDRASAARLASLLAALCDDDAAGAIVVTGAGPAFCTGAQFDSFLRRDPAPRLRDDVRDLSRALFDAFLDASKPVVAAVNGAAIGGGATQAALCDETLASTAAPFLALPAVARGAGGCASAHLARAVGAGAARAALDGASASLTAPNGTSQRRLLRVVLDRAAVAPASLEAHGTGTALGDPVEVGAAAAALAGGSGRRLVSSVKANLGHAEPAAAASGFALLVATSFERARRRTRASGG